MRPSISGPMTQPPAPQSLLEKIACKCLKGCQSHCGCKKLGIKCSVFCKECAGSNCENASELKISEDDSSLDIDDEIDMIVNMITSSFSVT